MNNSRYRWVIVAAGGLLGCVAIGGMFSLPVFLQPITRDTGWSVAGVSSAMTIGFLAMALRQVLRCQAGRHRWLSFNSSLDCWSAGRPRRSLRQ